MASTTNGNEHINLADDHDTRTFDGLALISIIRTRLDVLDFQRPWSKKII